MRKLMKVGVLLMLAPIAVEHIDAQGGNAASGGRYQLSGARTVVKGSPPPFRLIGYVYVLDKSSGQVQFCSGAFFYANGAGSLQSADAHCSPFPYVSQSTSPSSGAFTSASNFDLQTVVGGNVNSIYLVYWLADTLTGAVQFCATNSQVAQSRFPVKCVPAKVMPLV